MEFSDQGVEENFTGDTLQVDQENLIATLNQWIKLWKFTYSKSEIALLGL